MILLSLAHVLLDRPMQKRFESDPLFKATLLLLQERIPKAAPLHSHPAELSAIRGIAGGPEAPVRVFASPDTPMPEVQLLSNGRYHVMVTNAGGGSSRWKDLAVTRWREDSTCDNWGTFCYIRDVASGDFWSTAHQPTLKRAAHYEAIFTEARAEFRRRDNDFESHTEIVVSPEDDIELRRLRITNRSRTRRTIDVTSYAEVALAPPAADALHPAFCNLFVQTEIVPQRQAILCTRRPALARRAGAVDVPPHGRARGRYRGRFLRDRSHGVHRPRPHRRRSAGDDRAGGSRAARARCWIRSSRSGIGSRSIRSRRRRSTSRPASPKRATPRWASSENTRTGTSPTASSTSRGRTAG